MSRVIRPGLAGVACALTMMLVTADGVLAHAGEDVTPETLWSSWNFDPLIVLGIAIGAALYGAGVRELWHHGGIGTAVSGAQVAAFGGGIVALIVALVSPLDALGETLFSAHMVQHLILVLVAAPLLVFGAPLVPMLRAIPRTWCRPATAWTRRRAVRPLWRMVGHPLSVWSLNAAVLWFWHMPAFYQAAIRNELVHALEHVSFLGVASLFWWTLLQPFGRRTMPLGVGVMFVFTTAVQSSALGALLTFAPSPWFPVHADGVSSWGMTLLEDQQLAGLIMWVPAGLIYLATALITFAVWLRSFEAVQSMHPAADDASNA